MFSTIRKIGRMLLPRERRKLGLLLAGDTLVSIADIAFLAVLLIVVNFYAYGAAPHRWKVASWLWDRQSPALIIWFLLLFVIKSIAGYGMVRGRYHFVYKVATRMAVDNMQRYLESEFSEYVNVDSAVHARRIGQQPIEFCQYMLAGAIQAVSEVVLIGVAVAGILWYDAGLFLILLAILLPAIVLMTYITRRRLKSVRNQVKAGSEKAIQYLHEGLTGYVESNTYGRNEFFTERYARYQGELNRYLSELQITQGIPSRVIEVFAILGLCLLIALHATAFVTLGAFMAAAYKIIPGMVKLSNISAQFRIYGFTLEPPAGQGDPEAGDLRDGRHGPERLQSVHFEGVSFSYRQRTVLQDLSFAIRRGDFVGISGISGRGKTTIVNLLLGFYAPDKGCISFNGQLTDGPGRRRSWGRIAYVKQHAFLLHSTLLHNITLGSDLYDEQRMRAAIYHCGWQGSFPECLNGRVSEQGKNISGGQRQRIAIARALYKDADLIILDEPFNELDHASVLELLAHFRELSQSGRIVLLITHDKSCLDFCNKIIALNEHENA